MEKLKAIFNILFSEEYFVVTTKQINPYGKKSDGPIRYKYLYNTNKPFFFLYIKDYIDNKLNEICSLKKCVKK